jgi:hypothetical protein
MKKWEHRISVFLFLYIRHTSKHTAYLYNLLQRYRHTTQTVNLEMPVALAVPHAVKITNVYLFEFLLLI